jgi:DNA-binding transcriptional regulator YdaS (Cro superfamily)
MDCNQLRAWLRAVRGRVQWLADEIGVSRHFVRMMANGTKQVPPLRINQIRRAMRKRETLEESLHLDKE